MSGMEKIIAFDQSQSLDDFTPLARGGFADTPNRRGLILIVQRSNKGLGVHSMASQT
jgi:hypothetical protein